jgi:hypothetical protein
MRSVVRVLVAVVCLLLLVGGGWLAVALAQAAHLQRQVVRLEEEVRRQEELRKTMAERLGRTRRLGTLRVLQQHRAGDPKSTPLSTASAGELADEEIVTTVEFVELDDRGRQVGSRRAEVPGRVVFLDAWTVRFPQDRVAEDDPMRGRTVALLRRIYSDRMPPAQGIPIDTPGAVPDGYVVGDGARFEQALWKRFWRLATDPQAAESMGVRVAQGEAVYKPAAPGSCFDVELENSGGLTLKPSR